MNTFSLKTHARLHSRKSITGLLTLFLALITSFFSTANTANDYQLESKASNSKELYIDPAFAFATFKTMTVDVSVVDSDGNPISGGIALISDIPEDVLELSDQRLEQKSLISVVRTDDYGRIYQDVEVSNSVTKILLELNIQSQNNKIIVELDNAPYISHLFEVE